MACGCPVVAADRGAIPEVAGDAADSGGAERPRDPDGAAGGAGPDGVGAPAGRRPGAGGALHPGGDGPGRVGGRRGGGGMRIAMLGTRGIPAAYSGFETAVEHLAERFTARGHEVTVYCRPHMTERRETYVGARLVHLPTIRSKHLDTLAHTMVSTGHMATRARPDVALYFIAGNAPGGAARPVRGHPLGAPDRRARLGARQVVGAGAAYLRMAERFAPAAATIAVTDSAAVADSYERRYGRRIPWIPYGADVPDPGDAGWCRRLGVEPGRFTLFVGPAGAREQRPSADRGPAPAGARLAAGGGRRRAVLRRLHRRAEGRGRPRRDPAGIRLRRGLPRAGAPLRRDVRADRGGRHAPGDRGGHGGRRRRCW